MNCPYFYDYDYYYYYDYGYDDDDLDIGGYRSARTTRKCQDFEGPDGLVRQLSKCKHHEEAPKLVELLTQGQA
ncbi:hypothetical protein F441_03029 [Phytophthora nicotianae CJ01A1]|uniref:Uncharacterized protein n=4 Tax=Phytophthora nicotianae TaxID=4792 RepID=W3A340_PHYNI|nr:hypothetical protein L915_02914 [Phytophthora nicotianae]ETM00356.1 hypothetical protein L917_02915 [Phytophthora nicotianae]ETO58835.1 hypothetical protein F444_22782 [Phytophthora nicotianae P1976]ETP23899.1 hypothetical protein F441_03029 [Phytophthora nicotianae CJ01A1]ETP53988.1 hypothetical protein F442_01169 [Phytophthora nicotianae P10297]